MKKKTLSRCNWCKEFDYLTKDHCQECISKIEDIKRETANLYFLPVRSVKITKEPPLHSVVLDRTGSAWQLHPAGWSMCGSDNSWYYTWKQILAEKWNSEMAFPELQSKHVSLLWHPPTYEWEVEKIDWTFLSLRRRVHIFLNTPRNYTLLKNKKKENN